METIYFLGIDVSKKTFDAALTVNTKAFEAFKIENNPGPIEIFFNGLKKKFGISFSQLVVCMEHTGIYCLPLLHFCAKNKIKVCLESAVKIKKSQGIVRGKNDKVDARRIAVYAYKNREEIAFWQPQRLVIQKIKALLVTRERLVNIRKILSTPIKECEEFIDGAIYKSVAGSCQKSLKAISDDIKKVEKSILELINEDVVLKKQSSLVQSVVGIGNITAWNLIVTTGEFARISKAKRLACYSGVAPFEHTSGTSVRRKPRVSKMANLSIKTLLTLGARSAIKHDPELKAYAERKLAEGKHYFNVINAVRNKLITRIYACLREGRPYEKNYQNALA